MKISNMNLQTFTGDLIIGNKRVDINKINEIKQVDENNTEISYTFFNDHIYSSETRSYYSSKQNLSVVANVPIETVINTYKTIKSNDNLPQIVLREADNKNS